MAEIGHNIGNTPSDPFSPELFCNNRLAMEEAAVRFTSTGGLTPVIRAVDSSNLKRVQAERL